MAEGFTVSRAQVSERGERGKAEPHECVDKFCKGKEFWKVSATTAKCMKCDLKNMIMKNWRFVDWTEIP